MSSKPRLDSEQISFGIIFDRDASNKLDSFVDKLEGQGILRHFIDGNKLDEFIEKIKKHNVLRGQYIQLDSASQYLDGDWKSNFRIQAGRYLESLGVTDDSQICSGVEVMVARMEGNTFAPILFKMLVEYANTISTAYKNAIEFFYNQETQMIIFNEGMDFYTAEQKLLNLDALKAELLLSLVKAYPCGLIADTEKTDWMIRKEGTIKRVDFTELFDVVSFEACYQDVFEDGDPIGWITKQEVERITAENFKRLLLKDALSEITSEKKRTSPNFTKYFQQLAKEKPLYVNMRYVQAMFLCFLEEYKKRKIAKTIYANYTSAQGNIPS